MLLSIFLLTVIISFIGTYAIERIFVNCNIFIDKPSGRSSHSSAIPTAGGLAILFSYLVYVVSLSYIYNIQENSFFILFAALLPIIIIGLIDDLNEINIFVRLLAQFFSALIIIYYFQISKNIFDVNLYSQSSFIIIFLSVLLSMWLMNLYNFMDGVDGYASSESIFVSLSASLIAYINDPSNLIYIYILGIGLSNIGIIIRNWHPAKIFMGDTGSVSTGCILAFFIFFSASESVISIYTWLILLSIFISDSTYTLLVRIVTKKNISMPHLTHGFHILTNNKKSHLFTTKTMIIFNIIWVFPLAILSNIFMNYHIIISFIAYLPLLMYLIKIGAGLENSKIT